MAKTNFEDIFGSNSNEYLDSIIEIYGLKPIYLVYQDDTLDIIIDEQWKSTENDVVKVNRIFKFDILFLDLIKEESRLDVLKKVLDIYVRNENYEEAVYIRDIINFY